MKLCIINPMYTSLILVIVLSAYVSSISFCTNSGKTYLNNKYEITFGGSPDVITKIDDANYLGVKSFRKLTPDEILKIKNKQPILDTKNKNQWKQEEKEREREQRMQAEEKKRKEQERESQRKVERKMPELKTQSEQKKSDKYIIEQKRRREMRDMKRNMERDMDKQMRDIGRSIDQQMRGVERGLRGMKSDQFNPRIRRNRNNM